jgi:4a-hydroxytetrahydrobiopterin dehydratase
MWKEEDNKLKNSFSFKDFKQAMQFMNLVAEVAEEANHHPWWSNVYDKVEVELTTHDAGNTITEKDHKLAKKIDQIYLDLIGDYLHG